MLFRLHKDGINFNCTGKTVSFCLFDYKLEEEMYDLRINEERKMLLKIWNRVTR